MKDTETIRKTREILINDIKRFNLIICNEKKRLIHINHDINEIITDLGNYVIDYIYLATFNPKYVYEKIEFIKQLRQEKKVIEKNIFLKTQKRKELQENLKGINEYLCLI